MTSPANTEPRSNFGAQSNTEPFNTTNPFADDEQSATRSSSAGNGSHDESRNSAESWDKDERESKAERESNAKKQVQWVGESEVKVESHHDSLLDKIKSAADEATPAVVEKIASAVADKFHLHSIHVHGPSKFFNPTRVHAHIRFRDDDDYGDNTEGRSSVGTTSSLKRELSLLWRSRDSRKGRNSIIRPRKTFEKPEGSGILWSRPEFTSGLKEVGRGIKIMFTTFPYWNMAFWSGWSYSVGSALFVVDGALAWTAVAWPNTEFNGEDTYAVPLLFFFGAIFYQIGAVIAYLEAVNDGSFHGSAMGRILQGHEADQKVLLDEKLHGFFDHFVPHMHWHRDQAHTESSEKGGNVEIGEKPKQRGQPRGLIHPKTQAPRRGGVDLGEVEAGETISYFTWRWWPSWHMLKTRHAYEIGYIACTIQLFGVTLYGMTAIVVFPGIFDSLNPWQELAAYWVPQMVAAACFLIASIMFAFETQEKWWKPEITVLGWWIGFWSIIGSVGFELCAAFGPTSMTQTWAGYQSELSSMWGSAGYLVGSLLQWYEAVNKNPVDEIFNEPGNMKSYMVHPI